MSQDPDAQIAAIEKAVTDGVESVKSDAGEVKIVPLPDQIEAAKFLASQRRKKTIRMVRVLPPGAV